MKPTSTSAGIKLLFLVSGEIDDSVRVAVRTFVKSLASSRRWSTGPLVFVDQFETDGLESTETVGGYIELPEQGSHEIDKENESRTLEDVEALIEAVSGISALTKISFEFELGDTQLGEVVDGDVSNLQEYFIEPWRECLAKR